MSWGLETDVLHLQALQWNKLAIDYMKHCIVLSSRLLSPGHLANVAVSHISPAVHLREGAALPKQQQSHWSLLCLPLNLSPPCPPPR